MGRHRFVAQSPLQVLMAVEARQHFAADQRDELVLLLPGEAEAVAQIRSVARSTGWTEVVESPLRSRWPIAQARFVRQLADDPADALYVGDARWPLMRHLCSRHGTTPVLFDDGLGVERLCRERRSGEEPTDRRLADRLVRLDTTPPPTLTFFSMFDLEVGPDDTLIANDLSWLRRQAGQVEVDPDVTLVLGGCFAELGVMDDSVYESMVRRVIAASPGRVEYLPHRREPATKVERVLAGTGATRSPLKGPVEWSILTGGSAPSRLVTFFSTASYTLWRLFGDRIDFVTHDLEGVPVDQSWVRTHDMSGFLVDQTGGALTIEPLPAATPSPSATPWPSDRRTNTALPL